jgi:hypothetical protein
MFRLVSDVFQMHSEFERTVPLNNLMDYIICVGKLKYNSTM